ncbi:choline/ethanolamine kinase family protein [Nocardioides currus]|uniref:LPS biosynthesis choline kinase n=1 Tax=Nocardioides currus TaxID=2133958 RepID=A0A2R7Z2P4_9ACTN|nr:choline/ethanolamine kinase family protein [Nocardioides currus]PUA82880.1 LPS biosynthesis choline kinase [Nocardioides currus]
MTLDLYRSRLDEIPWLRGRTYDVQQLPGGLTNVNLKVTLPGGSVVVRIAQPGSELLAIDHDVEHLNSLAAAEAGVGAPVVDHLPEAGLMVVGYVEGRTFTDDDLRDSAQLPRVAAACRRLHAGPRFVNDFDMFAIQARYLATVRERGFRLPERYVDFEEQRDRIRAAFAVRPEPSVPCNNDLLAGNFIDDGTKIWLIDYEYSGNNDACFELGNVWSEAGLSLDQLDELMAAYDGTLLRHRVARARLWGLMSKYGWTLWGSIQDAVSDIDVDFWEWALEKYDRAVAEFEGPDFERLLEEVTRAD